MVDSETRLRFAQEVEVLEPGRYGQESDRCDAARLYARSTPALHLAVRGQPLVRGEEEWVRSHRWGDIGEPEGLAYQIGILERAARDEGWRVTSPYGGLPARCRPCPEIQVRAPAPSADDRRVVRRSLQEPQ
ncbi:hypothetical protein ABT075_08130 [Streptomyces sp. NPDC002677]|uniref:hypothetical protein n=1 Tax=Streptomyces sp. NPDC002677 TaxID=3154774 RepID=UPI00331BDA64